MNTMYVIRQHSHVSALQRTACSRAYIVPSGSRVEATCRPGMLAFGS